MTVTIDHRATLADVDEQTRQTLETAADDYKHGPDRLKAAILEAARNPHPEKPAAIARAIGYVYTYDYVARLVRKDRAANPQLYPAE